ncbi:HbrB-like-domain-containing protein [Lyophyllum atratum]|nr:HbrB-like-domain-containing protein [Lyophyllum atratum]
MWATSHPPQRSHDQNRTASPDNATDALGRSSTDATPSHPSTTTTTTTTLNSTPDVSSSKRLGFFSDKLSATAHSTLKSSLHPSQLLHPHTHSRNDSHQLPLSPPMATSSSMSNVSKSHTSPSKASYGRTYDSKLVSREMHRLGNLAHLPSALAPPITTAPSAASLALPAAGTPTNLASTSTSDPWGALHVHVLPLFNGEPLRIPIDLNVLVKRHIQSVVSSSPSKAVGGLEHDASELIASGMVTLNAKLMGIDDEKLVARVVEIWGFFWDQVLTYLEGTLYCPRFIGRPSPITEPLPQADKGSASSSMGSSSSASHIDVRSVALRSFRDKVILPLSQRLYMRLSIPNRQDNFQETSAYQQPRLQQMLLVLTSQRRPRPVAFSLTTPAPTPTAGEQAITDLLRIVRSPRPQYDARTQALKKLGPMSPLSRAPSFLSGALPRDRRGRIAHKQNGKVPHLSGLGLDVGEDEKFGNEKPRVGAVAHMADLEREREREFLEALRSPDLDTTATRASVGGWGLGAGHEDVSKTAEEEEEEELLDWNQAQAIVEHMDGFL